jgi:hypothetical protein
MTEDAQYLFGITQQSEQTATTAAGKNFLHMIFVHVSHSHRVQNLSPLNDSYQHHYNCDHNQNMDKPAHRVTGYKPQQPENDEYYSNRPQHLALLSGSSETVTDLPR